MWLWLYEIVKKVYAQKLDNMNTLNCRKYGRRTQLNIIHIIGITCIRTWHSSTTMWHSVKPRVIVACLGALNKVITPFTPNVILNERQGIQIKRPNRGLTFHLKDHWIKRFLWRPPRWRLRKWSKWKKGKRKGINFVF